MQLLFYKIAEELLLYFECPTTVNLLTASASPISGVAWEDHFPLVIAMNCIFKSGHTVALLILLNIRVVSAKVNL